MQRYITVLMSFGKFPNPDLQAFAHNIYSAMSGNAAFPDPPVAMPDLLQEVNDYGQAILAAQQGGVIQTSHLRAERAKTLKSLRQLARYVNHVAYNDGAKIAGSGFHPGKGERLPVPQPDMPQVTQLRPGRNKGSVRLQVAPVKGARSYITIITESAEQPRISVAQGTFLAPPGMAAVQAGVQRKMVIEGLQSGVRYRAQVAAVGTAGMSAFSSSIDFVTQ